MPSDADDRQQREHPHAEEDGERHLRAADPVGQPAAERPRDRADERAHEREPGEVGGDERVAREELREGVLDHERQRERVADERAERADVEDRHDPRLRLLERHRVRAPVRSRLREAVHVEPRAERGDDDERQPHEAGVGEVHLVLGQLHGRGRHADDDHERDQQLGDGDPQVAAGRVEAEREALSALGIEERDVRHRGGEVAAAEAGRRRAREQDPELRPVRLLGEPAARHDGCDEQRRDQQQRRADRRPRAAAEAGNRERVGDPQRRADEVRHGRQPERLGERQRDPDVAEVDHDDRPQHPDREAEVLGEDREGEVLAGGPPAGRLPEALVLRVPLVDPSSASHRSSVVSAQLVCRPR